MKKIIFAVLILGFVIAAGAVGYFIFNNSEPESPEPIVNPGPTTEPQSNPEPTPVPEPALPAEAPAEAGAEPAPNPEQPLDTLLLDKEQTISFEQCSRRELDDKVVILVSKYCSACKVVVPILEEIEKELEMEFLYFDLSDKQDSEKFGEYKIQAQWTPTVIIGCEVLIGGYSKEKYKTMIGL